MKNKFRLFVFAVTAGLVLLLSVHSLPSVRAAGPWYVSNSGSDGNDCASPTTTCASINGALNKPGFVAGDTIKVAVGTYTGTGTEVVLLNKNATLSGGWDAAFTTQSGISTIDGQNARRGITVNSSVSANLDRSTIQNGAAISGNGGGILNSGTLTLTNNVIRNNSADCLGTAIFNEGMLTATNARVEDNVGQRIYCLTVAIMNTGNMVLNNATISRNKIAGGIYNYGTLVVNNSTVNDNIGGGQNDTPGGIYNWGGTTTLNNSIVSGNTTYGGGGIFTGGGGTVILNNSTVSNNISTNLGGGINNYSGSINLRNTIVAGNNASVAGFDCSGIISSSGYNLIGNTTACSFSSSAGDLLNINPGIVYLAGYYALLPGSPAIDAGNPTGCRDQLGNLLTTDQRGTLRPLDGNGDGNSICDIGAYEFDPNNPIRQAFFPLISRPISLGIYGHVTFNGSAVSGVQLDLRFYNGSTWSTFASTTTGSDGSYSFLTAPSLGSGQRYYVRYLNSADTSRLSLWQTRLLTSYTAGGNAAIGDFDITNFTQISPVSAATIALPYLFQWNVRPFAPTDSYQFNLFNPFSSDGQPSWWTSPLGCVGNYSLNSLPTGFNSGTQYGWYVAIFSPDGGYGEPYYYRRVTFSNTGNSPQIKVPSTPKNLPEGLRQLPRSIEKHSP